MPPVIGATGAISGAEEADLSLVSEVRQKAAPFAELGVTGLKRAGGYIDEEFLPQLRGRKAVGVYREMSTNDPIVGGMLFAVSNLIRNIDWPVVPAGNNREDNNAAKLVETAMDDMSTSWQEMIGEITTGKLTYGWQWNEIVYKRRMGPWQRDGRHRSKYSDGLVGWRKMPTRAQETLLRWVFDDSGDVRAMIQLAPPDYKTRPLPIERSLLFRNGIHKNNPEGTSLLRTAYRPWFYKKRLEEFESIGVERDLAGLPMVKVPMSYLKERNPNSDQYKMVQSFRKMVRSIRRNEQEGVVFPTEVDEDTKQDKFGFELLGSGGARAFSTDTLIQRYENRILMTILADWIMVGHQSTGTYNMHVDKTGIFKTALNAMAQTTADIFNRHAIPRLFMQNGWKPERLPTIQPTDVDPPDLTQLAQFLTATNQLGYTWGPDADMEKWLRGIAGMPKLGEDDYRKHRREARREEATRFAEEEVRHLSTRSQLAQLKAQQAMDAQGVPHPDEAAQYAQAGQQQQQGADDNRRAEEQHQMGMVQAAAGDQQGGSAQTSQQGGSGRPQGRQ